MSLFTNEDKALLSQRLGEIFHRNSKYIRTTLVDGTLVIDFNNKLVLVSGEYGEDKIYGVVTVNSKYADDIDYYKEDIYAYTEAVRPDKNGFGEICRIVTDVQGEEFIRYYEGNDYSYQKGHSGKGNRATLPNNWQNYGYTADKQNGGGVSSKAWKGISVNQYRNRMFNKVGITEKSKVLDNTPGFEGMWEHLSNQYPEWFDKDTPSVSMPAEMLKVPEDLKPS